MYVIKVNDKFLRIYTNPDKTYDKVGFFLGKFVDLQQASVYRSKRNMMLTLKCLINELDIRKAAEKNLCIDFNPDDVRTRKIELKLVTQTKS